MKKIILSGLAVVALYSILVYAYGFDCYGTLDESTNYTMGNNITALGGPYYIGCSLNEVSAAVRILVVDLSNNSEVLNVIDYNVQYSNHYFEAENDKDYHVYVISSGTTGYATCIPL